MTDLYLIELPVNLRELNIWATQRKLIKQQVMDEGLVLHHVLGEIFGAASLQPFRIMVLPGSRKANLYAYSKQSSDELVACAKAVSLPTASAVINLDRLRSLPRPADSWKRGQRLGFDVRVRPVVRLSKPREIGGESKKQGAEIDVFQYRAETEDTKVSRETAYLDWLERIIENAATLDRGRSRLATFQRRRVTRHGHNIEGPDVVMHGTLVVSDPDAFHEKLAGGIGRHRSYGYGMLLLRPPQKVK